VSALYPHKSGKCCGISGPGLVHVIYGQGVGKTSRCVGLAVRAAGAGMKVAWVQFMKEGDSSEINTFKQIGNISFYCPDMKHPWLTEKGAEDVHFQHAQQALRLAHKALEDGAQILICDEILNAHYFGVIKLEEIAALVEACRGKTELLLSGASTSGEVLELADYATELKQIKHPYYQGQTARLGIEF
jgi:cob(I)alamin adenosyltransferase